METTINKKEMTMKKKLKKGWWLFIVALSLAFLRMGAAFFIAEDIYIGLGWYIGIMCALLFCIFAVFKWGKSEP